MGPSDWERIERSPEFRELVARRRRFVLPATVFFLTWYLAFVLLAGYAEDFMGTSLIEGFNVGYAIALTQFVMVAVLGVAYLRYSERVLDPLREQIVERYGDEEVAPDAAEERAERFARTPGTASTGPGEVPR
jgi:uncharacterized membrane protein (DUF485 family)